MKLENYKGRRHTLLKLYLLKYQAYKVNYEKLTSQTVHSIEFCLKQALTLIYLYHFNNKKILFIGSSNIKKSLALENSQHSFLEKKIWKPGSFSNGLVNLNQITSSVNGNFELVVFFNASFEDIHSLKELSALNYPLIILGSQIPLKSINTIHTVSAFLLKKKMKQLCLRLICRILQNPKSQNNLTKLLHKKHIK
tara:strand:+ start:27 stop:611 length:585 start_codon:yes stop_codon:yes gene_type:complete